MGVGKNFLLKRPAFLFVFWALVGVVYGVSGAVYSCFVVTFNVGMRDV